MPAATVAPEVAPATAAAPQSQSQPLVPVGAAPVVEAEVAKTVAAKVAPSQPQASPTHELKPNVPVVAVVAARPAASSAAPVKALQAKSDPLKPPVSRSKSEPSTATLKRESVVSKNKSAKDVVRDTHLSQPKLDLSLPPELVQQMTPPKSVITAPSKPILPPMFSSKDSSDKEAFELNGRLLSNEMQLQMRNSERREIEGAALDFKFKQ